MTTRIWTLQIHNHYGESADVYATEDGAKAALLEYVNENWENTCGREYTNRDGQTCTATDDPPESAEEAIYVFYATTLSEEWYTLESKPLKS